MRAEMGKDPTRVPQSQLNLPPGFRFYPTDEELVVHYLCKKAACEPFSVPIIAEVELYKFDPWDLPEKALFGEKEWYFFSPRDRKYPNGSRPNRAAGCGYWKATGTDKPINSNGMGGSNRKVGVKKALVFYKGKAPKGVKTNWIMHEYRLADQAPKPPSLIKRKLSSPGCSLRLDDWVLCRIYKKSSAASAASTATVSNLYSKLMKERASDTAGAASGLDEVLASLPEIDDGLNPLGETGKSGLRDFYVQHISALEESKFAGQKLKGFSYCRSDATSCFEEDGRTEMPGFEEDRKTERHHSPPESTLEEDSVESSFDALTSSMPMIMSSSNVLGAGSGGWWPGGNHQPLFSGSNFEALPSPLGLGSSLAPLFNDISDHFCGDMGFLQKSSS